MKKWKLLIALLGVACLTSAQEVDVFTVTDEVQVKNPPRFGMNYHSGSYGHWLKAIVGNQWNRFGSFEPIVMAHWNPVEDGGEDFLVNNKGWALSCWGQLTNGFWDGATLSVFRNNGAGFELLRTDRVLSSEMGKTTVDTLRLPKGPAIQAGDWYHLKNTGLLTFPDKVIDKMRARKKNPVSHFAKTVNYDGEVQWTLDDQSFCPEGGSTASMKLTLGLNAAIHEFTTGGTDPRFHTWDEGEYRWECWMKSEEPVTATVTFGDDNGPVKQTFSVGSAWKKYTFDFNPKEAFEGYASETALHKLRVSQPCSLWLDNWVVYRTDQPAFDMLPRYKALLKEFNPGCLRWCGGIGVYTLDAGLGDRFAQPTEVEATMAGYGSKMYNMRIPPFLRLCRELNSVPWLIMPGMMQPEDWSGLMDYLGGGADTKYGALRIAQGQTEPWTDVFERIYIEVGNEQWGRNFSHCFNGKPEIYGMLADMQFRRMKESPFYDAEKIKFIVNGWGKGGGRNGWWSLKANRACPNADTLDYACYFGGWDGKTLPGEGDAELFQNRMLYAPHIMEVEVLNNLCIDPLLGKNLAGVLLADPALLEEVSGAISSDRQVRNAARVALYYVGTVRDVPVALLAQKMIQQSPEIHAEISAGMGLEPDADIGLKGGISAILWIRPAQMKEMIQSRPEEVLKMAAALETGSAVLADIERVKNGEKPATSWGVANAIRDGLEEMVAERIGSDPAWIAAAEAAIPAMNLTEGRRRLINPAKDIPVVTAASVQGHFLREMSDTASARTLLKKVHENADDLFMEEALEASSRLLGGFTTAIAERPRFSYLRMDHLAPSTQIALADALCETIDQSTVTAPETRNLAKAVLRAVAGTDTETLNALCSAPEFIEEIRQSTADAIGDAIVDTMMADADIAEQITLGWDKLPKDPSTGNKRLTGYESGPGYSLPGPNVKPDPQMERYGKSLALGITTLDSFMYNLGRDFDHQNYFQFGFGNYFTSHNNPIDRFPHPSVLTLMMRNLYCTGDLMQVDNRAVKRHDIPDMVSVHINNAGKPQNMNVSGRKNIPWAMCYAFKEGTRHSFILYNRSFSESRTVQLKLPYTPKATAKIVRLEHDDPTANNLEEYQIQMKESAVTDFKNGYTFELKPASAVVIVNEEQ